MLPLGSIQTKCEKNWKWAYDWNLNTQFWNSISYKNALSSKGTKQKNKAIRMTCFAWCERHGTLQKHWANQVWAQPYFYQRKGEEEEEEGETKREILLGMGW